MEGFQRQTRRDIELKFRIAKKYENRMPILTIYPAQRHKS
jgi:hypothetical protein